MSMTKGHPTRRRVIPRSRETETSTVVVPPRARTWDLRIKSVLVTALMILNVRELVEG